MEIPVNLEKANSFLDATVGLEGLLDSKPRARKVIRRLGRSGRLVLTTAKGAKVSRGGCIVLHAPRSTREARRWVRERGFEERIDGIGSPVKANPDSVNCTASQTLQSMKGPKIRPELSRETEFGRV
jgi:hypothetical protein